MQHFPLHLDLKIRPIIRECGQQAEVLAAEQFQVSQKGPNDYVTNVDRILDQRLALAFSALFPEDGVVTEENAQSREAFRSDYSRIWFIDPLDGTEDFINARASYAVMVGLLAQGEPVAGWVYAPVQDEMVCGGTGWGLFETKGEGEPKPLPILEPPPFTTDPLPMLLGDRDQTNFGAAIARHLPEIQFYSLGSFGLKVLEVIRGRAGLYVYLNRRVKLWDTTGPLALAKAAGLVCCDLEGRPLSFDPADVDPQTLAHRQTIVVGWSHYVEALLPRLQKAVKASS